MGDEITYSHKVNTLIEFPWRSVFVNSIILDFVIPRKFCISILETRISSAFLNDNTRVTVTTGEFCISVS